MAGGPARQGELLGEQERTLGEWVKSTSGINQINHRKRLRKKLKKIPT
jgi:hypothetical protein